jgi:hypothetical protein
LIRSRAGVPICVQCTALRFQSAALGLDGPALGFQCSALGIEDTLVGLARRSNPAQREQQCQWDAKKV